MCFHHDPESGMYMDECAESLRLPGRCDDRDKNSGEIEGDRSVVIAYSDVSIDAVG